MSAWFCFDVPGAQLEILADGSVDRDGEVIMGQLTVTGITTETAAGFSERTVADGTLTEDEAETLLQGVLADPALAERLDRVAMRHVRERDYALRTEAREFWQGIG